MNLFKETTKQIKQNLTNFKSLFLPKTKRQKSNDDGLLIDKIGYFIKIETWKAKIAYIEQNPILLTDHAIQIFEETIKSAKSEEGHLYNLLTEHYNILNDYKKHRVNKVLINENSSAQKLEVTEAQIEFFIEVIKIIGEKNDQVHNFLEMNLHHLNIALIDILRMFARTEFDEHIAASVGIFCAILSELSLGNRSDNLEIALVGYDIILNIFTRDTDPEAWAEIQNNLANVYIQRIQGERADNIEQAIEYFNLSLKIATKENFPKLWAMIYTNLAIAYLYRIYDEQGKNIELSIKHLNLVLNIITKEKYPETWSFVQHNLALAYSRRVHGEPHKNIEQAIEYLNSALTVRTKEYYPEQWADTQHNLGNLYLQRIYGQQEKNIEQAVKHTQLALTIYTQKAFPDDWAMAQYNLGFIYHKIWLVSLAVIHYQNSLTIYPPTAFPHDHRRTASRLADLHFTQQQWTEVTDLYSSIQQANQIILNSAYTESGRQYEVGQYGQIYGQVCYAWLKLGRYGQALTILEEGKTRLLSEALALNEVDVSQLPREQQSAVQVKRQAVRELETALRLMDNEQQLNLSGLPDTRQERRRHVADQLAVARSELGALIDSIRAEHPDFMPTGLELSELLALIPAGGALIAPLITSQGSAAFVLPHGVELESSDDCKSLDDYILWLNDFTTETLRAMLIGSEDEPGWLRAYLNRRQNRAAWRAMIDTTTRQLWERLMGPIHNRLRALGMGPTDKPAPLIMMPQGGLGLLPLHAAWTEKHTLTPGLSPSEGEGSNRHYFMDDYTVRYAPSGYALQVSQQRLAEAGRQGQSLLAAVNPTGDLQYAYLESLAVAHLFPTPDLLPEDQATEQAVMEKAVGQAYLHFSCHGYYNWDHPMQSGLQLADEELSLADIISHLDLSANRLVTLSACETGLTEFQDSPDEFIGLPAGFLQAGAPGVLSTLWAVEDRATGLLLARFYHLHVIEGHPPAEALRTAQRWLRQASRDELVQVMESYFDFLPPQLHKPFGTAVTHFDWAGQPADRPYEIPYYWAAFTFSGL